MAKYHSGARRLRQSEYEDDCILLDALRVVSCIILLTIWIMLMLMILSWRFTGFTDKSLTPKPKPYHESIEITSETKAPEHSFQTLYYLYTVKPDGAITDDRMSKDSTILIRFTNTAMLMCYGWMPDKDSPLKYRLLTDGTYCRYDENAKAWQERAVVKTNIGRVYFIEDKGGKRDVICYSTAKEDITAEKEYGDEIVRSFYRTAG